MTETQLTGLILLTAVLVGIAWLYIRKSPKDSDTNSFNDGGETISHSTHIND